MWLHSILSTSHARSQTMQRKRMRLWCQVFTASATRFRSIVNNARMGRLTLLSFYMVVSFLLLDVTASYESVNMFETIRQLSCRLAVNLRNLWLFGIELQIRHIRYWSVVALSSRIILITADNQYPMSDINVGLTPVQRSQHKRYDHMLQNESAREWMLQGVKVPQSESSRFLLEL